MLDMQHFYLSTTTITKTLMCELPPCSLKTALGSHTMSSSILLLDIEKFYTWL